MKWKDRFDNLLENIENEIPLNPKYSKQQYKKKMQVFLQDAHAQFKIKKQRRKLKKKPKFTNVEKNKINNKVQVIFETFDASFEADIENLKNELNNKKIKKSIQLPTNLYSSDEENLNPAVDNLPSIPCNEVIFILCFQFMTNAILRSVLFFFSLFSAEISLLSL
jgi:uncharacterized protein YjdB